MTKQFIAGVTLLSFLGATSPVLAVPSNNSDLASHGVTIESKSGDISSRSDSFRVGDVGEMTLLLSNGSRVKVASNSEFRMNKNAKGESQIYLLTGRALVSANGPVSIDTYLSSASASAGEFIIEATPQGTGLRILSGNARMVAKGDVVANNLPSQLTQDQTVGDFQFGAQGKGKGPAVRSGNESTGVGEVSPDQDMENPGEDEAAAPVEETPPVTETTPPPTEPTTTTTTAATSGGGGGSILPYILGGLGLAGLIILLTQDDNPTQPIPTQPTPSPALP